MTAVVPGPPNCNKKYDKKEKKDKQAKKPEKNHRDKEDDTSSPSSSGDTDGKSSVKRLVRKKKINASTSWDL